MDEKLLRVPEVAGILGVKEATVRRMILRRQIEIVKVGRTVTIPRSAILRLIERGRRPALADR
jgi:excisionase family DNA binding protein